MPYCEDCGTKLDGGVCPNCHEELWIFENQIQQDGYDKPLSEEFAQKVHEQRKQIRKAGTK